MRIALIAIVLLYASLAHAVDRTASWTDNSNNEQSFVLQSCPGTCTAQSPSWTDLATVLANATSFKIVGVKPGTTTSYRVGAKNDAGITWSNIFVDVIPDVSPNAPTIFTLPPCKILTEIPGQPGAYQCS